MTDSRSATATAQGRGQGQPARTPAPAPAATPAPAPTPELYPQYCFHLSPTINKWCHLRAADIVALSSHPGFQGQDLYFHLNHPIKWVRICGIVVAVDVYGDVSRGKGQIQVVTIDDGSGEVMECVIPLAGSAAGAGAAQSFGQQQRQHQQQQQQHHQQQQQAQPPHPAQTLPQIDAEIDIGHLLDIKGSLRTFRDQRQVKVEKIVHLRTTEQEVAFWERIVQLRREVLDKPWTLEEKVVRKLKREAMGVDPEGDRKRKERERVREERRRERKRRRRLQLLEEEERRREKGVEAGLDMGEEEKEEKRMRRLEEERKARELVVREEEEEEENLKRKAAAAELELEEKEKERKRMKRLEEERMRLEQEGKVSLEGEKTVNTTAAPGFITARQHAQVVIPTRAKRNVTGLERRMPPVSRGPIPAPRPKEPTGLERRSKSLRQASTDRVVPFEVTGKYKALGL
ncbi:hypothetical protein B0T20DRAFT_136672 [Sordaria brevicollis]|uniref:CST complex subunit STN1 n=1 Tax=Sordaria brevicollis TaxID=83679 RepID=A0AAE0UFG0_SORBR|nr:hypothetical protein B0T20DRAFT_136672 [Sordaria brevicollis]